MTPELIIALALTAADASQTEWISQHPIGHCEDNRVIGKHPSQARVAGYFAASAGALVVANDVMTPEHAKILNYLWIGMEGGNVVRNLAIGVRFSL